MDRPVRARAYPHAVGQDRRPPYGRLAVEIGYVATVGVWTVLATRAPDDFDVTLWRAALAASLPAIVLVVPVLYVVTSTVRNLTGSGWPVTASYVVCLVAAATANVLVLRVWFPVARRDRSLVRDG